MIYFVEPFKNQLFKQLPSMIFAFYIKEDQNRYPPIYNLQASFMRCTKYPRGSSAYPNHTELRSHDLFSPALIIHQNNYSSTILTVNMLLYPLWYSFGNSNR